jgi:TonB family protein
MGDEGTRRYGLGLRQRGHIILVTAITTVLLTVAAYGAWEIAMLTRFFSLMAAERTAILADLHAAQARHAELYRHAGPHPVLDKFVPHGMQYPPVAIVKGEQGGVMLDLLIRPDGRVGDVTVVQSSGSTQLDGAALTQVGYWRFVPAVIDGKPIPAHKKFRIVWKLQDSPDSRIGRQDLPKP